jgi:hypothetical protein
MSMGRVVAAALLLLLPAPGIAQTSEEWRDLHRRKTVCYETECIINPLGVHRFLRPESTFTALPERKPHFSAPPAKPAPSDGVRERLGRERPFGIEGTPPRGVLRGSSPVIPRR